MTCKSQEIYHRNLKSDIEQSNKFLKINGNDYSANITWKNLGKHQA